MNSIPFFTKLSLDLYLFIYLNHMNIFILKSIRVHANFLPSLWAQYKNQMFLSLKRAELDFVIIKRHIKILSILWYIFKDNDCYFILNMHASFTVYDYSCFHICHFESCITYWCKALGRSSEYSLKQ